MNKYSLLNQDINTSFLNIETTWTGMRSPLLKKQIGHAVPDSFCELIKGETLNYFQNEKQSKSFLEHAPARYWPTEDYYQPSSARLSGCRARL